MSAGPCRIHGCEKFARASDGKYVCRLCIRASSAKYSKSKRGKLKRKLSSAIWRKTPIGREHVIRHKRKWSKTESGRMARRRLVGRYQKTAKGISAMKAYRDRPENKILSRLRKRVAVAVKSRGGTKSATTKNLLGCPIVDFILYLESKFEPGMTWENYGMVWHIDHIIPCAIFNLQDPLHQRACFHFSNMQPLFALDNIRKHASVNPGFNVEEYVKNTTGATYNVEGVITKLQ